MKVHCSEKIAFGRYFHGRSPPSVAFIPRAPPACDVQRIAKVHADLVILQSSNCQIWPGRANKQEQNFLATTPTTSLLFVLVERF